MGTGLAWRTHTYPEPLAYAEIIAWAQACRLDLAAWQWAALTLIDEIYRDCVANPQAKLPDIPATVSNMRSFLQVLGLKKKD